MKQYRRGLNSNAEETIAILESVKEGITDYQEWLRKQGDNYSFRWSVHNYSGKKDHPWHFEWTPMLGDQFAHLIDDNIRCEVIIKEEQLSTYVEKMKDL